MRKFTKYNEKLREDIKFWFSQIVKMYETPLFMSIASTKTIAKIGSKEVVAKTHGQEKVYVTSILCIIADSTKLPSILVIIDSLKEESKRKLKKHPLIQSQKIFAYCQRKAWIMKQ